MAGSTSAAESACPLVPSHVGACLLSLVLLAGCETTTPGTSLRESPSSSSIDLVGSAPGEKATLILHRDATREGAAGEIIRTSAAPPAVPPGEPGRPDLLPAPAVDGTAPAGEVWSFTLSRALAQSLFTNPDLVTLRGQVKVNAAAVGVAKTYPWNPFVQAQFFPRGHPFVANTPGQPASGTGYSNYYIWAMQRFELAHQTSHRIDSAMAAMSQVQWNIFQGELLNVAQTSRLYFTALYQKDIRDLARETAELNDRLLETVERRFKANLARAADVTTTRGSARQAHRQAELAETTYDAALLALRQQMNLSVNAPVALTERLTDLRWPALCREGVADEHRLAAELVAGRPDIRAAQAGIRVVLANLGLARAARIPDIQAGPIYETASDTTSYLGLRLQMNIPVFDTGTPLVRQREAELGQQQLTTEQLKVRAALEAEAAINQFERVRKLVEKERARSADAPSELAEITRQFDAGQADVLAVLTTQNNVLLERRLSLDLLNQLAQTASAVIQSTGLPVRHVVLTGTEAPACVPPPAEENPTP